MGAVYCTFSMSEMNGVDFVQFTEQLEFSLKLFDPLLQSVCVPETRRKH